MPCKGGSDREGTQVNFGQECDNHICNSDRNWWFHQNSKAVGDA